MNETRFTEADLEPTLEERAAARRDLADRAAACAAVVATGIWIGGMIALGACAAPAVFRLTPAPFSGEAMGAAFAQFNRIAIGAAAVLLLAEGVRTFAGRARSRTVGARVRRGAAVLMAAFAAYVGTFVTPRITELHQQGARRGVGPDGELLDRIHGHAEVLGKSEVVLGIVVACLHVLTLRGKRDDDDEEGSPAPLPPGPR